MISLAESDELQRVVGLTMSVLHALRSLIGFPGVWIASILFFCLGCSKTSSASRPESTQSGAFVTLTIGLPYPTLEDPLRGVRQAARLASLEGLTTQNIDGHVLPRLADSWTNSADGLTWVIRLRPSAVFHDGSPVDAVAVKRSLEQSLGANEGRLSPGLQNILSIEASAPQSLTIRLNQRSTLLLDDLEVPITKLDTKGSPIGTGPYVVTSTTAEEVVMTAFPRYYRGMPVIKKLVWRPYPTVRTAWAAAMRGEVDFLYEVGPESREFLQSETSIALYSFLRNYIYGVVFNARRSIFRDPEIRRALSHAVNRARIVEGAFRGHATVAQGPVWPLHWANDASIQAYIYDPGRAAASLQKSLVTRKGNQRDSTNLKFVCLIPENVQLWERLALMVQRDLAEIGVDMALEAVPVNTFNERITTGDFDAVVMEMISGFSVSRSFSFWHSSGLHSFSGYRNTSVDKALEDIRQASTDSDYREAFQRFQRAVFEDPPAIFLAWGETARAVSRRFNVIKAPGGDIRMSISDWKLASEAAN